MHNSTPGVVRAPLPAAPIAHPSESPQSYSTRLALYCLAHLSEHGAILTAGLTDDQLESACIGCNYALTQRATLGPPDDPQPTPTCVYDRLAATLTYLRGVQTSRTTHRQAQTAATAEAVSRLVGDTHPNGGKTVPIPPPPPRPLAPQHVREYEKVEIGF